MCFGAVSRQFAPFGFRRREGLRLCPVRQAECQVYLPAAFTASGAGVREPGGAQAAAKRRSPRELHKPRGGPGRGRRFLRSRQGAKQASLAAPIRPRRVCRGWWMRVEERTLIRPRQGGGQKTPATGRRDGCLGASRSPG